MPISKAAFFASFAFFAACTGRIGKPQVTRESGVYEQAVSSGVSVDSYGWSFVPIGGSSVTSKSATLTTTAGDILVAIGEVQTCNEVASISDSSSLSWTPIGSWMQDENNVGEGCSNLYMWAAPSPQSGNDTVTIHYNLSAGSAIGVLALSNAGMPINFTHSSDPVFPSPRFTMSPAPGSLLFGGAIDVNGDCCFTWSALANTTMHGGDGYTADEYGVFWTTAPAPGGPETFGVTTKNPSSVDWGGIAVEIPFSPGADGGTPPPPDGGTPGDAGTPDAGTCSWVCQ